MEKEIKKKETQLVVVVVVGNLQSGRICSLSIYFHWNKTDNKFCFQPASNSWTYIKVIQLLNIDKEPSHHHNHKISFYINKY